jgi:hypothetical protein
LKKFFVLLLLTASLLISLMSVAYSQTDAKGMAMCDRVEKRGICEEYRINTLTRSDKEIILKHCTSDALCPEQDRMAQCINYKDPDGVVVDKYYYRNVAGRKDWQADFVEETCINNNGKYVAN